MSPFTRETAALYGRKGGLKGGPARVKSTTKAERSKIARKGGKARAKAARAKEAAKVARSVRPESAS